MNKLKAISLGAAIALSIIFAPIPASAMTVEERAVIQSHINFLLEQVRILQALLLQLQAAPQVTAVLPEATGAPVSEASSAPVPAFAIEVLEQPARSGGHLSFRMTKDGNAMRDARYYEGKFLRLFDYAEFKVGADIVRTYTNDPDTLPYERDAYRLYFPGTQSTSTITMRVILDGSEATLTF